MAWITDDLQGAIFGVGKSVRRISKSSELVEIDDHRYTLWRRFKEGTPLSRMVAFIGLNPSTATPDKLDPTVSKCEHWAKAWGFDGFVMLNLFSYRATEPAEMKVQGEDASGWPDNHEAIKSICSESGLIVCCWGNDGACMQQSSTFRTLLTHLEKYALAINKTGEPKHPLYHKKDVKLEDLVRLV